MSAHADRALEIAIDALLDDTGLNAIVGAGGQRGVYKTVAPQKDPASAAKPRYPYVTLASMSAPVSSGNGGLKAMTRPLILARVWGGTGSQRRSAYDLVEAVLTSLRGTIDGLTIAGAVVEGEEVTNDAGLPGDPITPVLGARFRLFVT